LKAASQRAVAVQDGASLSSPIERYFEQLHVRRQPAGCSFPRNAVSLRIQGHANQRFQQHTNQRSGGALSAAPAGVER
jgi:hypothetical protein